MKRTKVTNPADSTTSTLDKLYIGIDNGVSGSIGWSGVCSSRLVRVHVFGQSRTPIFSQQNYTKAKGNITRIDSNQFRFMIKQLTRNNNTLVLIERPMVNPGRFKATISAIRALEATQVILERLELPYQFIDSKEWQKGILPSGVKGSTELKQAGLDIAKRIFPTVVCKPDADGILIAEWARRKGL